MVFRHSHKVGAKFEGARGVVKSFPPSLITPRMMAGVLGRPGPTTIPYVANAVNFNGTDTWLTRGADYTSNANSDQVLISMWLRMQGGDGSTQTFSVQQASASAYQIQRNSSNKWRFSGLTTAGGNRTDVTFDTSLVVASGWKHILFAKNGTTLQGYLSDVEDLGTPSQNSAGDIDLTQSDHSLGAQVGGGAKCDCDMAEIYIAFGQYLDISSEANRRKFIDDNGKPVDLGSDGSTPTSTAPTLFLSGDTSTWHTNLGSGGGMTENGTLTTASTSPSD